MAKANFVMQLKRSVVTLASIGSNCFYLSGFAKLFDLLSFLFYLSSVFICLRAGAAPSSKLSL